MKKILCCLLILSVLVSSDTWALTYAYGPGTNSMDARYGATIGAGAGWGPAYVPAAQASQTAGFGGNVSLSCSGIDFQGFLSKFNPQELLNDMKNTFISGAQAAVSSYLITLAYSNPTIASVLDMMDKKFTSRFDAFASACNAQQARRRGEELGASRMAAAEDECFQAQTQNGVSPTEAFRTCANAQTFGDMDIPALKNTRDFLSKYSNVNLNDNMAGFLKLLPDHEITTNGLQMKPAEMSTMDMYNNLQARSSNAIKSILGGKDPNSIPLCTQQDATTAASEQSSCIPPTASNLINSQTFLSARMLSASSQQMYADAMSSQVALTAMYTNIYELKQQISQIDVKQGSGGNADDAMKRRDELLKQVDRIEQEADSLKKVQEAKARLAKTQIMTMQKVQQELRDSAEDANSRPSGVSPFSKYLGYFIGG